MGWKTLKEQFGINKHIVKVSGGCICIGSGFIQDLVTINLITGQVSADTTFPDFLPEEYPALHSALPEAVLAAINAKDQFSAFIPVFTYSGSKIIEKQCEQLGWPNVTHDGEVMYENMFSPDREQVVRWALNNLQQIVKFEKEVVSRMERELGEARAQLAKEEAGLAKLKADYPAIAAEDGGDKSISENRKSKP